MECAGAVLNYHLRPAWTSQLNGRAKTGLCGPFYVAQEWMREEREAIEARATGERTTDPPDRQAISAPAPPSSPPRFSNAGNRRGKEDVIAIQFRLHSAFLHGFATNLS
jgi:hypothetical protein